ncbi:MAG: DUF429 domain-containing protein [Candidatus Methanoperedenaceae archaeon]|nr:DUF429 domain-containing protein [Candidatus Methanoperedenaceae archaeon]MDW7728020.1 DUF429 domain-containing protein [Candidatus Methanoperedens sp.]
MGPIYIGVDLGTTLRRKSTGIASLVQKDNMPCILTLPEHIISDDELIRSAISAFTGNSAEIIIGIDAPLSKPSHGTMRECEKRLRKHGIACYPSGSEWVSNWVDKGIALREWAENELGAKAIEVYPYAARRKMDIGALEKKKRKKGRKVIQTGLYPVISGLDGITGEKLLSDDELDAILSAYTAYCEGTGFAIEIDGEDGSIYIPQKRRNNMISEY